MFRYILTILSILAAFVYFYILYLHADLDKASWRKYYFIGDKTLMALPWLPLLMFVREKPILRKIIFSLLIFLAFRIAYDVFLIFLPQYKDDPRPVTGLFMILVTVSVYTFIFPFLDRLRVIKMILTLIAVACVWLIINNILPVYCYFGNHSTERILLSSLLTGIIYVTIIKRIWR